MASFNCKIKPHEHNKHVPKIVSNAELILKYCYEVVDVKATMKATCGVGGMRASHNLSGLIMMKMDANRRCRGCRNA